VLEVDRPNRQMRRQHGKSDTVDAESAARTVLGGQATILPKAGTGTVEMIRHLKIARDTAVKGRSQPTALGQNRAASSEMRLDARTAAHGDLRSTPQCRLIYGGPASGPRTHVA
jgi:acyl-coenzyme A thioesterase PaaI-like protein